MKNLNYFLFVLITLDLFIYVIADTSSGFWHIVDKVLVMGITGVVGYILGRSNSKPSRNKGP
jgi:uncharacterized protein YqhQ